MCTAPWHMHRCACDWHKSERYLGLKMQYLWNITMPGNANWSCLWLEFVLGIQYPISKGKYTVIMGTIRWIRILHKTKLDCLTKTKCTVFYKQAVIQWYLWNINMPGNADWSCLELEFVWGIQYRHIDKYTVIFLLGIVNFDELTSYGTYSFIPVTLTVFHIRPRYGLQHGITSYELNVAENLLFCQYLFCIYYIVTIGI